MTAESQLIIKEKINASKEAVFLNQAQLQLLV
jgi:hypothetical protein